MMRLLVALDGSEVSSRALEYAIGLRDKLSVPLALELVNVQPPMTAAVARFVSREVIDEYHEEQGEEVLAPARAQVEAAGVTFNCGVLVGRDAEALLEHAENHACDGIVMGTRGLGSVTGLLMGSVASKVVHGALVPVTLVR